MTPRVFLSFTNQDERDRTLAEFLATGLKTRGAEVVKAPGDLKRDAMWRPQLADAIRQATHFLVILSAASAGAPEVLDEIRQAKERLGDSGFRMLQIRTGDVTLPDAARFLNDYQRTPYGAPAAMLDALSETLGLRPRVRLAASTQALIDAKTRDFVGRDYVFQEIEEFLATNVSGYFTVIADPGMGKSSVLGEFVRRYGALAHFSARQEGITSAAQFLEDICAQLIAVADLPYSTLPEAALRDGAFLIQLLREAAEKLESRILIAVDALDEVDQEDHREANILFLPSVLPAKVYFILTRRDVDTCRLNATAAQCSLNLMEHPEENRADIEAFLKRAVKRERVHQWMAEQSLEEDKLIGELATRSESNFMYIVHVLFDIENRVYRDGGLERLPNGLKGYYEQHWQRMGMDRRPFPLTKIRIIGAIASARQPVSREFITDSVAFIDPNVDEIAVAEVLEEWKQFLHETRTASETRYNIYHASFLDFLSEKVKDHPALRVSHKDRMKKAFLG